MNKAKAVEFLDQWHALVNGDITHDEFMEYVDANTSPTPEPHNKTREEMIEEIIENISIIENFVNGGDQE